MADSQKNHIVASIAIPTFNGQEYLEDLLIAALEQECSFNYEIIVIDSGSTDRTLEILEKFHKDVLLHKIPNSEFGHGKTRNLAAKNAKGEFIVYLSQDAVPAHNKWLESMIEPFYLSPKVFCVVGKQNPRPFCDATTKREVSSVFSSLGPDHSLMVHRGSSLLTNNDLPQKLTFFSDVNSAVRLKYLLEKIPYRDVEYSEDQILGKDVLDAGYLKVYAPHGTVWHSNEYPLGRYFNRRFDEYLAMKKVLGIEPESRPLSLVKLFLLESFRDIKFTLKDKDYGLSQKIINVFTSPVRNFKRLHAGYIVAKKSLVNNGDKYSLEAKARKGS